MNARQKKILEFLTKDGEVNVGELARRLKVTTMTIRRDLHALEQQGNVIRTHGGALLANAGIIEFAFLKKGEENNAEKHAIALEIARMVEPAMTVTLDTGTTCLEVAKALSGISNLTLLTSSLAIASAVYARDNIDLVLLGGKARKGNPDLTGWLTEENLKHFRVDIAVLGAEGADREGVYTTDETVARVSQGMIACAGRTVLAADYTKFGRTSFLKYATWSDFDYVITDNKCPHDVQRWLHRVAKNVTYAKV
jgi:DeoR/GlpR family transcriptional regulator of sugar metabolism